MWEYHYKWFGEQKYGYLPGFLGGEQLSLYKFLPTADESNKKYFLIADTTYRIPELYRVKGYEWASERGNLIEQKEIGGFIVQYFERK